ncbi:MAG TPA: reverse transcriptase/maturase family protein [Syntrophales bacterium]|nr:reverse transcriptase/maturase family protein [Syntrophales bacterium]
MTEPPDLFSFANIYRCYLACRRNKRNTVNALRFEINAEENILRLERELRSRTYHPARSILFASRKPKLREIFAADFRDRVVHHVLVDHLERIYEPVFIHDSYACRKNKGTHAAVIRQQNFLQKISKNGKARAFYLQLDIKDFFTSIDKNVLFCLMKKKISGPDMLWLTEKILFHDPTKSFILRDSENIVNMVPANKSLFGKQNLKGLPIGNLTSQFFANVYLNELDQFVKHVLKARYYIRYVDDFVLLSEDEETLRVWWQEIEAFLAEKLLLRLHPKRRKLLPISNGIDFLGYIIRRDYILVRRRVVNNLKTCLRRFASCHCERPKGAKQPDVFRHPEATPKDLDSKLRFFTPRFLAKARAGFRMTAGEIALSRPKIGARNDRSQSRPPSFRKPATAGNRGVPPLPARQAGKGGERASPPEDGSVQAFWRTGFGILDSGASRNDNRRACIQSYLAHFKWANSYNLVKSLAGQAQFSIKN